MKFNLILFLIIAATAWATTGEGEGHIIEYKASKHEKGLKIFKKEPHVCRLEQMCEPKLHTIVVGKECAKFESKQVCDDWDVVGCLKKKKICERFHKIPQEKCDKWVKKCDKKTDVCVRQIDKCVKKKQLYAKECAEHKNVCAFWAFREEKVCVKYKCAQREKKCTEIEKKCERFEKFRKCAQHLKKCGKFIETKTTKCVKKKPVCAKFEVVKKKVCREKQLRCVEFGFEENTECAKFKQVCKKHKEHEIKKCVSERRFCEKYELTGEKKCKEWGERIVYKDVCAVKRMCKKFKSNATKHLIFKKKRCVRKRRVVHKKIKFCKMWEYPTKCVKFTSKCTEFRRLKTITCVEHENVCVAVKKTKKHFCKHKKAFCVKVDEIVDKKCVKKKNICVEMRQDTTKKCAHFFQICTHHHKWKRCAKEVKICRKEKEGGCIKYDLKHCLKHKTIKHVFCKHENKICTKFVKKPMGHTCVKRKKYCIQHVRKCLRTKLECAEVKKWFIVGKCKKFVERCILKGPIKTNKCQRHHTIQVCVKEKPILYNYTTVTCRLKKMCKKCPVRTVVRDIVKKEVTICKCGKCRKKIVGVKVKGLKKPKFMSVAKCKK